VGLPRRSAKRQGGSSGQNGGAEGVLQNAEMCNNYLLLFDYELKPIFKELYQEFWLQKEISARYPSLWGVVKKLLVAFPKSYFVKRGFSVVMQLLSE
jgi:hypothetical protein